MWRGGIINYHGIALPVSPGAAGQKENLRRNTMLDFLEIAKKLGAKRTIATTQTDRLQ